jgi:hypothetical protein
VRPRTGSIHFFRARGCRAAVLFFFFFFFCLGWTGALRGCANEGDASCSFLLLFLYGCGAMLTGLCFSARRGVWTLAPGSEVRALAGPFFEGNILGLVCVCLALHSAPDERVESEVGLAQPLMRKTVVHAGPKPKSCANKPNFPSARAVVSF